MSTIQISGSFVDPFNNAKADVLKVVCVEGEGQVLPTAEGEFTADADGSYDFQLVYGTFEIYVYNDRQWNLMGTVLVDASVPSVVTMNELLANHAVPV